MSILLTGGTGQTSSRVARLLLSANKKVILASRNPAPSSVTPTQQSVKFDWANPSMYEDPFKTSLGKVESAYLVSPGISEVFDTMRGFMDVAIEKGVQRFVFIGATTDGPAFTKVQEYLANSGVDYCVVRPTWFFENALTIHSHSIKVDNEIITATGNGKVGLVSADDIADLVAEALLVEKSYNTDLFLTGPELLSYDQVAETFSSVLGRTIKHTRISEEDLKKRMTSWGLPEDYAGVLAYSESLIAKGEEERIFAISPPKKRTGKRTLREFVEQNKDVWL